MTTPPFQPGQQVKFSADAAQHGFDTNKIYTVTRCELSDANPGEELWNIKGQADDGSSFTCINDRANIRLVAA